MFVGCQGGLWGLWGVLLCVGRYTGFLKVCGVQKYGHRSMGRWEKEYDLSHFILKMYTF
eukprot:COSAG06_NODE_57046_length_282_cov_0.508197_1_plen_58_part_10